jgi:mRNA interferase MazF
MTNPPKRGEIWLADLDPTQGSEQAGIRPMIIFRMILFPSSQLQPLPFLSPPINVALPCQYAY